MEKNIKKHKGENYYRGKGTETGPKGYLPSKSPEKYSAKKASGDISRHPKRPVEQSGKRITPNPRRKQELKNRRKDSGVEAHSHPPPRLGHREEGRGQIYHKRRGVDHSSSDISDVGILDSGEEDSLRSLEEEKEILEEEKERESQINPLEGEGEEGGRYERGGGMEIRKEARWWKDAEQIDSNNEDSLKDHKHSESSMVDNGISIKPEGGDSKIEKRDPVLSEREEELNNLQLIPIVRQHIEYIPINELTDDEIMLLKIWSSPLVTKVGGDSEFSKYGRGILGVDIIESQGLVKASHHQNHLIGVIETFYAKYNLLEYEEFLTILTQATYKKGKALIIAPNIVRLGDLWERFKNDCHKKQLKPKERYVRPIILGKVTEEDSQREKKVPVLAKLGVVEEEAKAEERIEEDIETTDIYFTQKYLPYINTDLTEVGTYCDQARKLLGLNRTDGKELAKREFIRTLLDLIAKYEDLILSEDLRVKVRSDIYICLMKHSGKTDELLAKLIKMTREYKIMHPQFITHYCELLSLNNKLIPMSPNMKDIVLFGGGNILSPLQGGELVQLITGCRKIRSISLIGTQLGNLGIKEICKYFSKYQWKGVKESEPGLFALDLSLNLITREGVTPIKDALFDQVGIVQETPIFSTTIRILCLDFNPLEKDGADIIGELLNNNKSLRVLSLQNCSIYGLHTSGLFRGLSNNDRIVSLRLCCNPLNDLGIIQLFMAIASNQSLQMLDLFDIEFGDEGANKIAEALMYNKSIIWLQMANTSVTPTIAKLLLNSVLASENIKTFRWSNIGEIPQDSGPQGPTDMRVILCEKIYQRITMESYTCSWIGNLQYTLYEDKFKCINPNTHHLNTELADLYYSYYKWIMEYWEVLETGMLVHLPNTPLKSTRPAIPSSMINSQMPRIKEDDIKASLGLTEFKSKGGKTVNTETLYETLMIIPAEEHKGQSYDKLISKLQTMYSGEPHNNTFYKTLHKGPNILNQIEREVKLIDKRQAEIYNKLRKIILERLVLVSDGMEIQRNTPAVQDYFPTPHSKQFGTSLIHLLISFNFHDPTLKVSDQSENAVIEAIESNRPKILEMLLENGGEIYQTCKGEGRKGCTPLHLAVSLNNIQIVQVIILHLQQYTQIRKSPAPTTQSNLDNGAESENKLMLKCLFIKNWAGETPLDLAIRLNLEDIIDLLRLNYEIFNDKYEEEEEKEEDEGTESQIKNNEKGVKPTEKQNTGKEKKGGIKKKEKATSIEVSAELLIGTIKNGESDQFVEYLNLGHNINCYDKDHLTPLHHALLTQEEQMAAICIKKECNVNAVDLKGMTPMHVAALRSNNKYIIDLLLSNGAEIDAQNANGNTPLILALRRGRTDIAQTLLKYGANPKILNKVKRSAINFTSSQEMKNLIVQYCNNRSTVQVS